MYQHAREPQTRTGLRYVSFARVRRIEDQLVHNLFVVLHAPVFLSTILHPDTYRTCTGTEAAGGAASGQSYR